MNRIITLIGLLFFSTHIFSQNNGTRYVKKYKELAEQFSAEYGIPSAIILGVAIIESGNGQDRNAKLLHNHFGMIGKNDLLKTKGIKTKFRQYKSDTASYKDFCKMLSKRKYYAGLKGNEDYGLWVVAMKKSGYSTSPDLWQNLVMDAIKKYKLSSFKTAVKPNTAKPEKATVKPANESQQKSTSTGTNNFLPSYNNVGYYNRFQSAMGAS
jgi:flagellum-specific peptidoglycan hydrolase FlgJ